MLREPRGAAGAGTVRLSRPALFELSDNICTALQLTNFWQDVAIDFSRDRIYLPQEDMARFGYTLDDLRAGRYDRAWQELLSLRNRAHPRAFRAGEKLAGGSAAANCARNCA